MKALLKTYNNRLVVVSYFPIEGDYALVYYKSNKKKSLFKVNKEELK